MNKYDISIGLLLLLVGSAAQAANCDGEDQSKAPQVSQKLDLLARLLDDSEPLRRAERDGNVEALAKIEEARQTLVDARAALEDGCVSDASSLSSSGLKLATTAFRKSPKSNRAQEREQYESALQLSTSFLLSLEAQPQELHELSADDLVGIERQIDRAESLASGGNFAEAMRLLAPVNDRLQRRLATILNNKTIYYEKTFATPADEYAYYKEQYEGYLLLLNTGQKQAAYSARNRVASLLESASTLSEEAGLSAAAQSWDDAIAKMQEAVTHSEQAVRTSGYTY
jgi:hypothetical protein